jgi:hypothetical protein
VKLACFLLMVVFGFFIASDFDHDEVVAAQVGMVTGGALGLIAGTIIGAKK